MALVVLNHINVFSSQIDNIGNNTTLTIWVFVGLWETSGVDEVFVILFNVNENNKDYWL